MADPRSTPITRKGTGHPFNDTFKIDNSDITYDALQPGGSAVAGRAVMLSGDGIVRLTGAGSHVLGKLTQVEPDGACTVTIDNTVVTLPKGDGAIAAGARIVGDVRGSVRGYVRSVAAATLAEVAVASHRVLDASDADNVEVLLSA